MVRIPHPLLPDDRKHFQQATDDLQNQGFTTIFVFDGLVASSIQGEFEGFALDSLLFLRDVRLVELKTNTDTIYTVQRRNMRSFTKVRLLGAEHQSQWAVIERGGVSLAFSEGEAGIERLDEQQANLHAFLPTHEVTGFPIKINSDFSTDPSRTRIVMDERTDSSISAIATMVVGLIDECLNTMHELDSARVLAALVPFYDPRVSLFKRRSFVTALLPKMQSRAGGMFKDVLLRPKWLNRADFETLSSSIRYRLLPRGLDDEIARSFFSFLGARPATLGDLSGSLERNPPSILGAAEVAAHIVQRVNTKQIQANDVSHNWRIWPINNECESLVVAARKETLLDEILVNIVSERIGTESELRRLLMMLVGTESAAKMLPERMAPTPRTFPN